MKVTEEAKKEVTGEAKKEVTGEAKDKVIRPPRPPRIKIHDDRDSWLKWGKLVREWIEQGKNWTWIDDEGKEKGRPTTVGDLKGLLRKRGIGAEVDGSNTRPVNIVDYPDRSNDPLWIYIPTKKMLDAKMAFVRPGPYPYELMPSFYDIAYGPCPRVNLSDEQAKDFALMRVGEYTVNECC